MSRSWVQSSPLAPSLIETYGIQADWKSEFRPIRYPIGTPKNNDAWLNFANFWCLVFCNCLLMYKPDGETFSRFQLKAGNMSERHPFSEKSGPARASEPHPGPFLFFSAHFSAFWLFNYAAPSPIEGWPAAMAANGGTLINSLQTMKVMRECTESLSVLAHEVLHPLWWGAPFRHLSFPRDGAERFNAYKI